MTPKYLHEFRLAIVLSLETRFRLVLAAFNLEGIRTVVDFTGFIGSLLALHQFNNLFNSLLQFDSRLVMLVFDQTKQVSSVKRRGLDKVALAILFT